MVTLLTLILLTAGVIIAIFLYRSHISFRTSAGLPASNGRRQNFSIAVLAPIPSSGTEYLCEGIKQQLNASSGGQYSVKLYYGINDRVSIFSQAQKALNQSDVLVTHGVTCTTIGKKAALLSKKETPLIFSGIRSHTLDKVQEGEIYPHLLGVVSRRNHIMMINKLKSLKPDIQSLLIIHHARGVALQEITEISNYCGAQSIETDLCYLEYQSNSVKQITANNKSYDTIMLMPRTLTSERIQELISYCNEEGITLCAHDLDAVTLGAAIGFGGEEKKVGGLIGRQIRNILELKKIRQSDLLLEHVEQYHVHINKKTMLKQGLSLRDDHLFFLDQGGQVS